INSENPPGRELEAASYVAEELAKIGVKTKIDRFEEYRANVIGIIDVIDKPSILLNTHLDTVPAGDRDLWTISPFSGELRNGRIYGRGSVDAKGIIASMLGALRNLAEKGWPIRGKIIFSGVADEEVEGKGTKKLVNSGIRTDYAIVGEPTSLKVCTAHKGRLVIDVNFFGRSVHASIPSKGRNAIYYASRFIESIQRIRFRERHKLLAHPTCSATIIRGGVKDNIIPDKCTVTLDIRVLPSMKVEEVIKKLNKILEKTLPKKSYNLRIVNYIPPAETSSKNLLVKIALESLSEVIGRKTRPIGLQATCDMSFLVNQAKIPTIILGPGKIEDAHTVDESINVDELVEASLIYEKILEKILS
ncbi:MAG: M20 family metallopeptidase, partial [Aigarchaeota archaeon]|nr:M20 family metallopeptidase [Aigarchaeota archaeon]